MDGYFESMVVVLLVFLVGEDEQVLFTAAESVQEERQRCRHFCRANLQDKGDVFEYAVGEGGTFLAELYLRDRTGFCGRGPLEDRVIAALTAAEEAGGEVEYRTEYGRA